MDASGRLAAAGVAPDRTGEGSYPVSNSAAIAPAAAIIAASSFT